MKSFSRWIAMFSVAMHASRKWCFIFLLRLLAFGNLLTNCKSFLRIFYGALKRVIFLVRWLQAFMSLLLLRVINRMRIYETCGTSPRASNRTLHGAELWEVTVCGLWKNRHNFECERWRQLAESATDYFESFSDFIMRIIAFLIFHWIIDRDYQRACCF